MSEPKKRRRRGERPDGRIEVTYTDGHSPDGTPHRLHFYGNTRAEAERKRDEYKARGAVGLVADRNSTGMTVNEWVDKWISVYAINTAMYGVYIERVRADVGRLQLDSVREADLVQSLKAYRGKSTSAATKYRMILQQIFRKARVNRLIVWDPAEDLQLPKAAAPVGHRALERREVDFILSNWAAHRAGRWVLLMLLAGLRRGELMALTWQAVDMDARVLRVSQTAVIHGNKATIEKRAKTAAGLREVPLCDTLYRALDAVPPALRAGFVCKSAHGEQLTEAGFSRGFEGFNACMSRLAANVDTDQRGHRSDLVGALPSGFSMKPHDLRHTFATLLYDAGVDVKAASYLLGHSDSRITMEVYTHLSAERAKASAAALVGVLDGIKAP